MGRGISRRGAEYAEKKTKISCGRDFLSLLCAFAPSREIIVFFTQSRKVAKKNDQIQEPSAFLCALCASARNKSESSGLALDIERSQNVATP